MCGHHPKCKTRVDHLEKIKLLRGSNVCTIPQADLEFVIKHEERWIKIEQEKKCNITR